MEAAARPPALVVATRRVLAATAVVVSLYALYRLITLYPYGVDLEIPLRAAARWVAGERPYLPEAFQLVAGPDLPFLYPPLTLPGFAVLEAIPRLVLFPAWTGACIVAGAWACRRLAVPWPLVPAVLIWPPFAEAIIGGNVQVFLFAAFVAVVLDRPAESLRPVARDPGAARDHPARDGLLSAFVGAFKVSQAHTWLYVLRRRPSAAVLGAAVVLGLAVVSLPLLGINVWFDWLDQAGRSGDPTWKPVGVPLSVFVGRELGLVVTALSFAAIAVVPPRSAAAAIGLLSIVGAPSLHMFGLLFLIPAMLEIRREIALVAAILIATYTDLGLVIGVVLVGAAWVGSRRVAVFAERASA